MCKDFFHSETNIYVQKVQMCIPNGALGITVTGLSLLGNINSLIQILLHIENNITIKCQNIICMICYSYIMKIHKTKHFVY